MNDDIQVISDGTGIALFGDPTELDLLLTESGLPSRELSLDRIRRGTSQTGTILQGMSNAAAQSGRWVKLTEKSAKALNESSRLMTGSTKGVSRAITTKPNGQITGILEIMTPGAGLSALANPALLAGVGGIMAQAAMQQSMDEIKEYLAVIDEKVDDILRAQKDAVLADVIGVGLILDQAMTVREQVGHVSEVTWSTVQQAPMTLLQTLAYALRQLDALADKLEKRSSLSEIAKTAKDIEPTVREWLAVLARTFQLRESTDVLALDRLFEVAPDEVDAHRLGLVTAHQNQLQQVLTSTKRLVDRLDAVGASANAKVMLHPIAAREAVAASNSIASTIADFHELLGIELGRQEMEARRWRDAVADAKDRALESGAEGVGAAKQAGDEAVDRFLDAGTNFAGSLADRLSRARAKRAESRSDSED